MPIARDFSLDAKYRQEEGVVFLSGIQALVRLPLDQHRADRRRGLNTATHDLGLPRLAAGRARPHARAQPADARRAQRGLRLRASTRTSAPPSSTAASSPTTSRSRSTTVCSACGTARAPASTAPATSSSTPTSPASAKNGGVLALGGDDPLSKSSTLPTHSEVAFYDAQFPVLFPGSVQEILDMGRLGFELSRYSGLWVGFKIVTNVADEIGTAEVAPGRVSIVDPALRVGRPPVAAHAEPDAAAALRPRDGARDPLRAPGGGQGLRRRQRAQPRGARHARGAGWGWSPPARRTTTCARRSHELGLDDAALRQHGIRILKIGMMSPMEPAIARHFARGLEEILVVEEKRSFIEMFLRDTLYNDAGPPAHRGQARRAGPPAGPGQRRARRRSHRPARGQPARAQAADRVHHRARGAAGSAARAPGAADAGAPGRTSARAARTTARRSCRRARWPPPASAATAWR